MAVKMSTERIITLAMGVIGAGGFGTGVYQQQTSGDCAPAVVEAQKLCDEDCLKREREIRDYSLRMRAGG